MMIFLDKTRLIKLGDSVLLVGIVLLVYDLASLANSDADFFDQTTFFNTVVAYVNSFTVVYLYWSLFSVLLTYIEKVDVMLFLLFIVFLILVTLVPVANILFLQQRNQQSQNFHAFIHVVPGIILMFAMFLRKHELTRMGHKDYRHELISITIIPAIYFVSFLFAFLDSMISQLIPFFVIPLFILVGSKIHKSDH
jgi:uncharacterized membrane protein